MNTTCLKIVGRFRFTLYVLPCQLSQIADAQSSQACEQERTLDHVVLARARVEKTEH